MSQLSDFTKQKNLRPPVKVCQWDCGTKKFWALGFAWAGLWLMELMYQVTNGLGLKNVSPCDLQSISKITRFSGKKLRFRSEDLFFF